MGSFKIKRLDLPKHIIEIFEKQNLYTCRDALSLTSLELQSLFGISSEKALNLQAVISRKCVTEPSSVYDLYLNQQKNYRNAFFPLSLPHLDMLLQGGLLLGSITET